MGEKRTYKARKPGGGRKKQKPEYDAGENLKEQMESAVTLYEEDCSLRAIADVLTLNPIKVRKLLITAGIYKSEAAEKVQDTFEEYRETQNYKERRVLSEYSRKREDQCWSRAAAEIQSNKKTEIRANRGAPVGDGLAVFGCALYYLFRLTLYL